MFLLTIYTPEKVVFEDYIQSVSVPGENGFFEVLTDHAALMAVLKEGLVTIIKKNKSIQYYTLSGGLFEVKKNIASLLADEIHLDKRDKKDVE